MAWFAPWLLFLGMIAVPGLAQEPKPQEPPEEDESLAPREYTFNPLQAAKELKVGHFYFRKGSYKAAALRFEEATKWDSNLAEAWLKLGEAREKLKDDEGARSAYTKYVELAPDTKQAKELKKRFGNQLTSGNRRS